MSLTLLFPGQGSQYVGMGKNFFDLHAVKDTFSEASDVLGFDLTELCFNGPLEKLTETKFTQPAILTHSVALFRVLKPYLDNHQIKIDSVIGHSVGEFSALVASDVLDFKDAVKAVHLRGQYMQEATPIGVGAMYAILRLGEDVIREACQKVSDEKFQVMPANFNDPTQIVVSGHKEACEKLVSYLSENIKERHMAIPLKVSAPFHSTLMKPAEDNLRKFLETITFKENSIPYIANIDSKIYGVGTNPNTIRENSIRQVTGSVLFTQSVEKLEDGASVIEVGPGKVLTGLSKKINSKLRIYTIDSDYGFTKLPEFFR